MSASLDLDDATPRTPSGHPLDPPGVRERPQNGARTANGTVGQQTPALTHRRAS